MSVDENGKGRRRRTYTPEQKAEAVRRHLQREEAISVICKDLDINPTQYYRWQADLLENAAKAFEGKKRGRRPPSREKQLEREVEQLQERIAKKDNVIAEMAQECVGLKKKAGRG